MLVHFGSGLQACHCRSDRQQVSCPRGLFLPINPCVGSGHSENYSHAGQQQDSFFILPLQPAPDNIVLTRLQLMISLPLLLTARHYFKPLLHGIK